MRRADLAAAVAAIGIVLATLAGAAIARERPPQIERVAAATGALSLSNSRENAATNGVGDELVLEVGSVTEILAGQFPFRSAPLVVANILAPVIVRLFDAGLAELVDEGGAIILSGILFEQEQSVVEAAQAKGLRMNERRQMGDWVALSLSR